MFASLINIRFTAEDVSLSSHKHVGIPVSFERAFAQSRLACAAGPKEPSSEIGMPTTSPPTPCSVASALISFAISPSLVR